MSLAEDRARIHDALAQRGAADDGPVEGGLLTAWVVVCEWATPDGERWLIRLSSDAMTSWLRDGMLTTATTDGDWDDDGGDD